MRSVKASTKGTGVLSFPMHRVRPVRPYVRAYCQYALMFPPTAQALIRQAVNDDAPATAVYKTEGRWVLFESLDAESQACILDLMSLMPGGIP